MCLRAFRIYSARIYGATLNGAPVFAAHHYMVQRFPPSVPSCACRLRRYGLWQAAAGGARVLPAWVPEIQGSSDAEGGLGPSAGLSGPCAEELCESVTGRPEPSAAANWSSTHTR